MSMRITKYPPLQGRSVDLHKALPPSVPPPPPSPPNPAPVPGAAWAVVITNPLMGLILTGKWSMASVVTEGLGDVLQGHDWGPLQIHIPMAMPVITSPSQGVLPLTSSTKYFLPSFSIQEKVDGTFPGGGTPVAISFPVFMIQTQNCQDYFPSLLSVCFQLVSTRWVGFTLGDALAGVICVAGDALAQNVGSLFGGSVFPGDTVNAAVGNALLGHGIGLATNVIGAVGGKVAGVDAGKMSRTMAGAAALGAGGGPLAGALLGPLISDGAGMLASDVGNTWGSTESSEGTRQPSTDGDGH